MSDKQWGPLATPEAVIEAITAGRHVEFTACGCGYQEKSGAWVEAKKYARYDSRRMLSYGGKYRALISPAQPAADVDPADAELADAIAKGTEAWSGLPEDWVDELRGGRADDAAERIAARVPLPELGINTAAHYGPRIKGYTADQLRAAILAGVREAMRVDAWRNAVLDALSVVGDAPADATPAEVVRLLVSRTEMIASDPALRGGAAVAWRIKWSPFPKGRPELTDDRARVEHILSLDSPPRIDPLYTAPSAGRVGVSDAMVSQALDSKHDGSDWLRCALQNCGLDKDEQFAVVRAALTAALQEPK